MQHEGSQGNSSASAVEYERVARAVNFAHSILRRRDVLTDTDRRILSDLEHVYMGLRREASLARGDAPKWVSGTTSPFAMRMDRVRKIPEPPTPA